MAHLNYKKVIFLASLCSFSIICSNVQAQGTTVVEKKAIITPVPKSMNCSTVAAHWEGDVWIDTQTVCSYENRVEGVAWVQDYWSCTKYDLSKGQCTNWEYKSGHWVKTMPQ